MAERKYTADEVIKEALKWLGYLEKKYSGTDAQMKNKTWNAGSNNITWFWTWLKRNGCLDLQGGAWCDGYVDFCHAIVAGIEKAKKSLNGYSGYTPDSAQRYKDAGRWVPANGEPMRGDQIFFKNSTRICHTGIVTKVTAATIYTVEGNTSSASGVVANGGCVRQKSYPRSYSRIAGYGRPLYSDFCIISKGMTGTIVGDRQKLLIQKGFSCGSSGADKDCGNDTVKAIKAAQKALGLTQSGHLNKTTYNALLKLANVNDNKTSESTLFKKYSLTDAQVRGLAALCFQEQGCLNGVMAEASLMCNLFEKQKKYIKLVDYVLYGGWFAKAETYYNKGVKKSVGAKYDEAVRRVICGGLRVLPSYVDEHDCFSDIKSATNNGTAITKTNRNSYKKDITKIKNCYGSSYTFYCFPDTGCDPFGYTQKEENDFCYDYNGNLVKITSTSKSSDNKKINKTVKWMGKTTATLNVRNDAGAENKQCSFSPLKQGVEVSVCDTVKDSKGADWYYIKYNGKYGFVSAKYIVKAK